MVVNGEIVIVDEFTGRMMPGRQWQDGLHQAIQAKEKLEVTLETITAARVTVQDFFLRYKKLAGMTGTAATDAAELRRIYKVHVFHVPTNRPGRRVWHPDRVFSTEAEKFQAVAKEIVTFNRRGVPVLIGTRSIEKSERLDRPADGREDRAPGAQRQEPRDRGPDRRAGGPARARDRGDQHGRARDRHQAGRRGSPSKAACTSSAPSGTSRAGSTASSPGDAPARAIPATASSSSRSKTRSSKPSARSPPPASASDTAIAAS